jgi:hypoxanthine phosphoribosyltransferase
MRPNPSTSQPPGIAPLFDVDALRQQVSTLGRRIEEDLGGEDPLLLALLGGSLVFFADLVRAIQRPVRFELIHVGYHATHPAGPAGEDDGDGEVLEIHYPIPVDIEGQTVVVVKDVVGSGVTEPYLEQQLRDRGARAVRFAALIDRPDERKTPFELHYHAFTTAQPGTLVGYGMKHEGRYGNLPYVGRLNEES